MLEVPYVLHGSFNRFEIRIKHRRWINFFLFQKVDIRS